MGMSNHPGMADRSDESDEPASSPIGSTIPQPGSPAGRVVSAKAITVQIIPPFAPLVECKAELLDGAAMPALGAFSPAHILLPPEPPTFVGVRMPVQPNFPARAAGVRAVAAPLHARRVGAAVVRPRANPYLDTVRTQLLSQWQGQYGFVDDYGYVIDRKIPEGTPMTIGEGGLHTAIAIIALVTGNYEQDAWEAQGVNPAVEKFLDALATHSWGNQDGFGRKHPIRHPDDYDWDKNGKRLRNSPMTKDSFGAIIAACNYAYDCPNSSPAVRAKAKDLVQKWMDYLVLHQWRLHSSTHPSYIEGEYEEKDDQYANLFSGPNQEPKAHKGPEAFLLFPHEVYALKTVGAALGLSTAQIRPWEVDLPVGLLQTVVDLVAPYLADLVAHHLGGVLSALKIEVPYSIDFGTEPVWALKGALVIDPLPAEVQDKVVEQFRNVLSDAIREVFRLYFLGEFQQSELVGIAVNAILDQMPDTLGKDSWRSVLMRAMEALDRWLDADGIIEVFTFVLSLQLLKKFNKADVTSYTAWSFVAEMQNSQEMTALLTPFVQEFWGGIRTHGNPNGLWAWLARDMARVDEQIALFQANDPARWDKFAYGSTKFDEWMNSTNDGERASPRIDYLVIHGLAEKGLPKSLVETAVDWWATFEGEANKAVDALIKAIKEKFEAAGHFVREIIHASGERLREVWEANGRYTRELIKVGGQVVDRLISELGGEVRRWLYTAEGVFEHYLRWERLLPDGSLSDSELVERMSRSAQGVLERWTYTTEHAFESYSRWWRSAVDGIAAGVDMVESKIRELSGALTVITWSTSGVFETKRRWWRSAVDGAAQAQDLVEMKVRDATGAVKRWTWSAVGHVFETAMKWWRSASDGAMQGVDLIEKTVRDASGVLDRWNWAPGKVFERHTKWWRSTVDGAAVGADLAESLVRDAAGVLQKWTYTAQGAFESYSRWVNSTIAGTAEAVDMVERRRRDAAGTLQKWLFSNGVMQKYWRWVNTGPDGSATADMLRKKMTKAANGELIVELWNELGQHTKSIFDKFGDLIGGANIPAPTWPPPWF